LFQVVDEVTAEQRIALAETLSALGSPARLAILGQLRAARTLREIEVHAVEPGARAERAERTLSRQAIREHLDRLVEIGVVIPREAERTYGATVEYLLSQQKLFAVSEEFRSLARLRPVAEPGGVTISAEPSSSAYELSGPCLIMVKGLEEGTTFDLRPTGPGPAEWVIGRKRGLAVSIDFDPYVSTENTLIYAEGGAHFVKDLPDSKNGTTLNFRPLAKGKAHVLRTGSLIGIGRTLLMFQG